MINSAEYFGLKIHTQAQDDAAVELLERVNTMLADELGWTFPKDPDTGSAISGSRNGAGDGGFRLPTATTGSPTSSHKEAKAVDVYDPENRIDEWLDGFEHGDGDNSMLAKHGLYREHPSATPGWCHLSTRAPRSGRRTFNP